ncbi:DUF4148 domain-containing protein [Paracandidimonas lactea]|uniref:DUF4148 domain-containing protein n=1 Tax=Paracandidimonas lactea TaxID=2895524 RepID=UPI001F226560|nr:DUF4148 domain-containing protein [Paracandidimonas lactea]
MKTLITGLMLSFSLVAGAAQATPVDVPERKTRAQVVAELQEARASGLLSSGELDYPPVISDRSSSKSRQTVLAELDAARKAGMLSNGELDYPPASAVKSSKTRAEVRAELAAYEAAGLMQPVPY